MKFLVGLAGIPIEIETKFSSVLYACKDFLLTDSQTSLPIIVTANEEDWNREWSQSIYYDGKIGSYKQKSYTPMMDMKALFRSITEQLLDYSALLMHGSVVSDGKFAYMFTAPSGVGKTTRSHLFLDRFPNSFILNGDKPIIRVEDQRVIAYSSPWKGKENEGVNASIPLKAIYLLERSDETTLEEITADQAFPFLLKQVYVPTGNNRALQTMHLLRSFDGKVRIFRYHSAPTIESVEAAWVSANSG